MTSPVPSPPPSTAAPVLLEENQRLSTSCLWQLQRGYFDRQGVHAFRTATVPHYVTNNPALATAYAQVVLGVLRDRRPSAAQPLTLVELGAGSGRFAFLFLQALFALLAPLGLADTLVRYVMTDFTGANLSFWRQHPGLRPFVDAGVLDFAVFDAERDDALTLTETGVTLTQADPRQPLVVIANYVFDGLSQDAFSVKDGRLHEVLMSLYQTTEAPAAAGEDAPFAGLTSTYLERECPADVYPEPEFNAILQGYASDPSEAALLFPVAALRCLRRLADLGGGALCLLCADKGEVDARDARLLGKGGIVVHGSFSLSVDFHAIAAYFRARGGSALTTTFRQPSLALCVFLLDPDPTAPGDHRELRLAYQQAIEDGRAQDLFTLNHAVPRESLSFAGLLSLLRLSRWDPQVLQSSLPFLWARLEQATDAGRAELQRAVQRTWASYYHIGEPRDLAFDCGLLLYALDAYPEALGFFERSRALYGADPRTLWNLGLCHVRLQDPAAAAAAFTEAVRLHPGFAPQGTLQYKEPAT